MPSLPDGRALTSFLANPSSIAHPLDRGPQDMKAPWIQEPRGRRQSLGCCPTAQNKHRGLGSHTAAGGAEAEPSPGPTLHRAGFFSRLIRLWGPRRML